MKRMMMVLGILLATLLLVVACAPKEADKAPVKDEAPEKDTVEEVKQEEVKETATTPDEDITVVDKEVIEIDDITGDLDMNDLEELDKELADLENLEI